MFALLFISGGFAAAVLRYTDKKWTIYTFTSLLFWWAIIFIAVGFVAPQQMKSAAVSIDDQCKDNTSGLFIIDKVYAKSSAYLCNPGNCYCNADLSLWNETALMELWNETEINVNITDLKEAYAVGDWRTVIYAVKKIFNFEGADKL